MSLDRSASVFVSRCVHVYVCHSAQSSNWREGTALLNISWSTVCSQLQWTTCIICPQEALDRELELQKEAKVNHVHVFHMRLCFS